MLELEKQIFEMVSQKRIEPNDAALLLTKCNKSFASPSDDKVAIIGISGKFPKADDAKAFWRNIFYSVNCIDSFPEERRKDFITKGNNDQLEQSNMFLKGGYLNNISDFAADFFKIAPIEAKFMDPIQRLMLEETYLAFEDAGYSEESVQGSKTGVFIGYDHTIGQWYREHAQEDPMLMTGTWSGLLASRIAYYFNFKGPSFVIDCSCSSGLVSVHEACTEILNGNCEMAVAGGLYINYEPFRNSFLNVVSSPNNDIKAFDKDANGTVWGEGIGVVVLKKLSQALKDHDAIYGVIKGSAVNNDGASDGITAPNAAAQEEVICEAWNKAGVKPEQITYIEAHGTGTKLGDTIEIDSLKKAFSRYTNQKQFCAIGSVKTNIGHSVAASGIASLFKVLFAMRNKKLPSTINFYYPNPFIDFTGSPVYVNDKVCDWIVPNNQARIAAINSFGFSGTNCHMVIEEVEQRKIGKKEEKESYHLLTISAKSEKSLEQLVLNYINFLQCDKEVDLDNLCYTAAVGRSHFRYRIIILFKNYKDLLEKLRMIDYNRAKTYDGIHYGVYRIVKNSLDRTENDSTHMITSVEKEKLTDLANKCVAALKNKEDIELYQALCKLYVQGADIHWNTIYAEKECYRIHIPVYAFDRTHYWCDQEDDDINRNISEIELKKVFQPDRIVESSESIIYEFDFNVENDWVLKEHRIYGQYVLPGTAYIEMLFELVNNHQSNYTVEDLVFSQPFIVQEGSISCLQLVIKRASQERKFCFCSKDELNKEWIKHAEGKLVDLQIKEQRAIDLDWFDSFQKAEKAENMKGKQEAITTGERWNNIRNIYQRPEECLVELYLPESFQQEYDCYVYHPSVLDNAVNMAVGSFEKELYLPYYYNTIHVYRKIDGRVYSYIKKNKNSNESESTLSFDILIFNEKKEIIMDIRDYVIKKVKHINFTKAYLKKKWILEPLAESESKTVGDSTVLVLKGFGNVADKLLQGIKDNYAKVIELNYGDAVNSTQDTYYASTKNDYEVIMRKLKDKKISRIFHLMSITDDEIRNVHDLEKAQDKGFNSLYYLLHGIVASERIEPLDIVILFDYANKVTGKERKIHPEHGCIAGIAKSIPAEFPQIKVSCLDVDEETDATKIIKEQATKYIGTYAAYRNNERYVETFEEAEINLDHSEEKIKKNGVYLITGGTGEIGIEIAKYFSSHGAGSIYILSRHGLCERKDWQSVLSKPKGTREKRVIQDILSMEKQGTAIYIKKTDVSDEAMMQQVIQEIHMQHNNIDGVIHCAGVAGTGLLLRKTSNQIKEVLAPKVMGTYLLDHLLKDDKLDFFVMFSSIQSLLGGIGQGDYVAANMYMDMYSDFMETKGRKGITINWPLWNGIGMQPQNTEVGSLDMGLLPEVALEILGELLSCDERQIIVVDRNMYHKFQKQTKEVILDEHQQMEKDNFIHREDEEDDESRISSIIKKVLQLKEINLMDNFEDLGGNSLLAIKLQKELEKVYPNIFSVSDIFSYPTVYELARFLKKKKNRLNRSNVLEGSSTLTIEQIMVELENGNITSDEADKLIQKL